ncbi:CbtB-domain containing protein [Roseovarius aestuarii]|nr:CbtB-domain containing protein [Roseovarius aestuarii]
MTVQTEAQGLSRNLSRAQFVPALFVAIMGVALITLTGHVQASTLHDAAHDVRHATGFPCH